MPYEDDEPAQPVRLERIPGVPNRVLVGLFLVVALIVVAILKPWASSPSAQPPAAAVVVQTQSGGTLPTSAATAGNEGTTAAAAALGRLCNAPPIWRLMTKETSELGESRTMYSVDAVSASGPADASIKTAGISALSLDGIGVCGPSTTDANVPDATHPVSVRIWTFDRQGQPMLASTVVADAALYAVGEAYYGPVGANPQAAGLSAAWAPGRYAVEVDDAAPEGGALWFGLDYAGQEAVVSGR